MADSLTAKADSVKSSSDIDSVIYASSSDSLVFFVANKKMNVYGTGDLRYKTTQLKSGQIFVDFTTRDIQAEGILKKDTTGEHLVQTPVLNDKGEDYKGNRMTYNFTTTKGFITFAATKEEEASYSGAKINKVAKKVFFIEDGVYTTCDAKEPHYCFFGQEMKMIQKDQVIGKWVWLTFAGVPFPVPLPFIVMPLQSGRRSGLIAPAFGDRPGFGKYFSHFGYFWAIDDHMDLNLTSDIYTKGGFGLQSRFRYAMRYNFSGSIEGSYSNLTQGRTTDPDYYQQKDWRIRVLHNQELTPTSRFDVNLEFLSGNYFRQNTTDFKDLLRNQIYSNASYFKSWEESGTSLSANYNRTQDLSSGDITEVLPSVSFSKSQFYPFRSSGAGAEEKWYELLGINYSGQFENNRRKTKGELSVRGGVQHQLNFGFSPKVGYFNLSPFFSYREFWYNKRIEKLAYLSSTGADSIVTNDVNEINSVRTFSLGVSTATKIYGVVQPQFLGVAAVRHIIQPSVSYSYTPDFSKQGWNYCGTYTNAKGEIQKYNKFEREIYGGASNREIQNMNFRVDNIFEMKTMVDPTDTLSKEQKIQLLNLSADASYDLAADSMRFSDIRLGYRTQVGSWLSLSGSSSYSIYDYDNDGRSINRTLLSGRKKLMRLNSFSFSASISLSAERSGGTETNTNTAAPVYEDYMFQENRMYKGLYETGDADFTIPWSMSLNYNYSLSRYNPMLTSIYSNISGNVNFNLTPNWKFSLTGSYDITNKQFAAPQINISRDLHCWIMNFTWNPLGTYTGYRFEIRVKAPQLQDLKVTKSDNFFSGRR